MKLEERINEKYDEFSPGDRLLANYIVSHQAQCREINCEQLADACHVSRATLLRFCRKLGLQSFNEFRYLLKITVSGEHPPCTDLDLQFENYHTMIDEMANRDYQEICTLLFHATTIYIYGTGNAQKSEAEEFKRIFLSVGKCVVDLFDIGEISFIKDTFRETDVFVIISLSGETPAGITLLKEILPTAVQTLSITRWNSNTIARMCRYNLYVGTKKLQGYGALSYEMMGTFYVLLDALFVSYLNLYGRGSLEN